MGRLKAGLATCTTGHRDVHDGILPLFTGFFSPEVVWGQLEGWASLLLLWSQGDSGNICCINSLKGAFLGMTARWIRDW